MERYEAFVWWIRCQDLAHIKFMDKVHFEGKNVSRNFGQLFYFFFWLQQELLQKESI